MSVTVIITPAEVAVLKAIEVHMASTGKPPTQRELIQEGYLNQIIKDNGIPVEGTNSVARLQRIIKALRKAGLMPESGRYEMTVKGQRFIAGAARDWPIYTVFTDGEVVRQDTMSSVINFRTPRS